MATYNGENFIGKQIESLLRQSYRNLEIIISDDCSIDNTYSICESYARLDKRIRILKNDESNRGFISNFQHALSFCTGEYIALADQDDIWYEAKLSKLLNEIGDSDLIFSDANLIDSKDDMIAESYSVVAQKYIPPRNVIDIILNNPVTGCTLMFKGSLLDKIIPFPQGIPAHDQWIALNAILYSGIKYIHEPLIGYRQHSNNQIGANVHDRSILSRIKAVILKAKNNKILVQECKQLRLITETLSSRRIRCVLTEKDVTELSSLAAYYSNLLSKRSFFSVLWFRIKKHDVFTPQKSMKIKLIGVISVFKVILNG